jgi:peptidoglycan/LPS O-acetylase OafA/YrhL
VADALAMGCLLALLQPVLRSYQRVFANRRFFAIPIVTALLPLTENYFNKFYHSVGLTLLHLGIALSIHHAVQQRIWFLNLKPIAWVGVMSYSLYLWQEPFLNRTSSSIWTSFPLNLALVFAFGAASHYFVERPFLRLREASAENRRKHDLPIAPPLIPSGSIAPNPGGVSPKASAD